MTNRDGHPAYIAVATSIHVMMILSMMVSCDALWPQRHHDARASSCADVHIGTEPLWCQATIDSVRTGVQVAIHHASLDDQAIVGMNHVMYYIYKRTSLVAAHIDAPPNQFLWRVDLSPVPFGSNPALDPIRGIIYVLQGGPIAMTLLAFDPNDGRYLWKQSVENVAAVSAPVVHPSGVVLIAVLNDAELSAIYAFNGPPTSFIGDLTIWNYTRTGAAAGVANAPAVGPLRWSIVPNPNDATNGTVYVLFSRDDDATLVALHPATGALMWEVTFPDSHPADVPTIVRHDGTILVAGRVVTPDGHIVGDADSGLVIAVGAALPSLPAGPSFALLGLKQVIGRTDPPEDDHIWSFTAEGEILGATVDGSMVYVSAIYGALDQQGILYGLNMTDGQMLWRLAVPSNDAIVGSAVVAGDGTLLWMCGQSIYRIGHCSGRGNCSSITREENKPIQPLHQHQHQQPVCSCAADWYAANCSVSCTQAQCATTMPIGAHTECGDDGTCTCIDGWYPAGECTRQCDVNTCRRTHGNHAHCNDLGLCVCDGAYYTPTCDKKCLHGTIHANGTICKCAPNYFGDDEHTSCVVFCERVESCSNHGTCGTNGQCICDTSAFWSLSRYSGDECVDGLNMKPWLSIGLPMLSICLIICVLRALRRARRAARHQAEYDQQHMSKGDGDEDDSMTNGRSLHSGATNTANNSTTDVLSSDLQSSLLSSSTSSTSTNSNSNNLRRVPPPLVVTTQQPSLRSIPSLNSPRSGGLGPGPRGFALGSSPVVNRFASNNSNNNGSNNNNNSNSNNSNNGSGSGNGRTVAVSMPRSPSGSEPIGSGMAALTPKKFQSLNPRQAMMNGMVGSPVSSSYIPPSSLSSNASSRSSVLRVTSSGGATPSSPSHARSIAARNNNTNNNNNTATRNNNGAIAGLPAPLLLSPPTVMPGSMSIPSHMMDSSAYSPSSHDDSPLMSPHATSTTVAAVASSSVIRSPTLPTGWKT